MSHETRISQVTRIVAGRVGSGGFQNLAGRVGSGQDVFKSRGSGRVGSGGFQNLAGRVGSRRLEILAGRVGSGRVGSGQDVSKFSRIGSGQLTRPDPIRSVKSPGNLYLVPGMENGKWKKNPFLVV